MTRRFKRLPLLIVTAMLGVFACEADAPPDRLFLDDFETLCEGVPCGWVQADGSTGQARWVETIHPGEHGLALTDDVVVRRTNIDGAVVPVSNMAIGVRGAVRCDLGSRLELDVVLIEPSGGRRDVNLMLTNVPQDWGSAFETTLFLDMPLTSARVTSVVVRKRGAGTCEISELLIDGTLIDDVSC